MEIVLYFFTYFILYSFVGWLLESISKTIAQKKLVNSGFLNGPVCPIYGIGAIIMLLSLSFLKEKPILLFIAAFIILSLWEYIVGVFLEKVFKTKYWDYSNIKFNFQGRICLKNSIYWGILGVLFICYVHPIVDGYIKLIPTKMLLYVNIIVGIVIVIDSIISAKTAINFDTMINKINEMNTTIKEKIKELKELKNKSKQKIADIEKNTIISTEKRIKELKISQAKLKIRIYRQANRLKRAFPSMKSESITAFLNQKIDLKNLRRKIKKENKE